MAQGVITLAEMRAKGITMLEVACNRCERRGRLRIARLIAEHGTGVLDLCAIVAVDCPRMRNPASIHDLWGAFSCVAALVSDPTVRRRVALC